MKVQLQQFLRFRWMITLEENLYSTEKSKDMSLHSLLVISKVASNIRYVIEYTWSISTKDNYLFKKCCISKKSERTVKTAKALAVFLQHNAALAPKWQYHFSSSVKWGHIWVILLAITQPHYP